MRSQLRPGDAVFIARKRSEDAMHHLGVAPGDGSEDWIADLYHIGDWCERTRTWDIEHVTMLDEPSLCEYEFVDAQSLEEVSLDEVKETLLQ